MPGGTLAADPILLVEDNDDVREALAMVLKARGYRVVETRDGTEAWEYLERGGPASVIVLDLILPRMDGRLFRAKQLTQADLACIPVIVFTATDEALPDTVAVVRKSNPDSLLDIIDRAAGYPAIVT